MNFKDNVLAIKITAISVSVAAFIVAFSFFLLSARSPYSYYEKQSEKHAVEYTDHIDELMQQREYLELDEYCEANKVRFDFDSDYYVYMDVLRHVKSFKTIHEELVKVALREGDFDSVIKYRPQNVAAYIYRMNLDINESSLASKNYPKNIERFLRQLKIDTGYYLIAVLNLSEDDIAGMETMTETQIASLIEEAYRNVWTK